MSEKCTVVVCSCDAYEDIWNPFFTLLHKYWSDCPYEIILNTETKSYTFPDMNIHTLQLYQKPNEVPWTKRLKDTLKQIQTPYVIILMEDFFLKSRVDQKIIDQCIVWMDEDPKITCFDMYVTTHRKVNGKYPGFMKRPRFSQYKFNTEADLWRREDLIHYLRDDEDPWIWEFIGNLRSFRVSKDFYVTAEGVKPNFDYNTAAISRGKWNVKAVDQVFHDNEISVDYDKRGRLSAEEGKFRTVENMNWKNLGPLRILHSYIVNICRHPKSLFFQGE